MPTLLTDTFTGANGAAWNSSNWTMYDGTQTIQGNRGQISHGGYSAGTGNAQIEVVPNIPANFSFTGQVQLTSSSSLFSIEYRNNGSDYYQMWIQPSIVSIYQTPWPILLGSSSISTTTSDVINFRLEVDGNSHKLRIWLNSASEPSTWDISATSSTSTTTTVPMRLRVGDPNPVIAYLDNVSITSNTLVKYPAANSGGVSSYASQYATPETAYSAASTGAANFGASTAFPFIGQTMEYDPSEDLYNSFCYETFLEFDTSGGGTVDSATLKLWLNADYSTTDFTVQVYAFDYGASIVPSLPPSGDWQNPTQLSALTPLLGSLNTSGIGSAGAKIITLSTSAVNLSGPTRLIVVSNRTRSGTLPSNDEYIQITLANSVLEYTTTGPTGVDGLTEVGAVTRSQPSISVSAAARAQIGVSTRSTVQPEPSVSSVAKVGASTRSALSVSNDVTVDARTQVGVSTRSQPTITVSIETATRVGVSTRSTVRPEPSVASVSEIGVSTRSQPTITVSVPTMAKVGAALSVSGELAASIPGTATATFAAPTATVAFAAPTATATITAPTATMTFSKEP